MNLGCSLCKEEATRDCKLLNNLICEGCCEYELRESLDAPEYIKLRTGLTISWTTMINTCSQCRHRTKSQF